MCLVLFGLLFGGSINPVSASIPDFPQFEGRVGKKACEGNEPVFGDVDEIETFGVSILSLAPLFTELATDEVVPADGVLLGDKDL